MDERRKANGTFVEKKEEVPQPVPTPIMVQTKLEEHEGHEEEKVRFYFSLHMILHNVNNNKLNNIN